MNEDNVNVEGLEDFDELDNKIILNDEDGNEIEFEFLDVVEVDDQEYVVLLPVEREASPQASFCFPIEVELGPIALLLLF